MENFKRNHTYNSYYTSSNRLNTVKNNNFSGSTENESLSQSNSSITTSITILLSHQIRFLQNKIDDLQLLIGKEYFFLRKFIFFFFFFYAEQIQFIEK